MTISLNTLKKTAAGTALTQTCAGMAGLSFTFSQNGDRGASENAPGQNRDTETIPPSAVPSTPPGQMDQQNG